MRVQRIDYVVDPSVLGRYQYYLRGKRLVQRCWPHTVFPLFLGAHGSSDVVNNGVEVPPDQH